MFPNGARGMPGHAPRERGKSSGTGGPPTRIHKAATGKSDALNRSRSRRSTFSLVERVLVDGEVTSQYSAASMLERSARPNLPGPAVALTSMTMMIAELVLTRIFSVVVWYHFAFFAISVALFGASAAAIVVHLFQARLLGERARAVLAWTAA